MSAVVKFPMADELDVEHLIEPAYYVYQEVTDGPNGDSIFVHVGFAYEVENEDTHEPGLLVKHHPDAPPGDADTVFVLTPTPQEDSWSVYPPKQQP